VTESRSLRQNFVLGYYVRVKKYIELQKRKVPYILKTSSRSRSVRLAIYSGGEFVVTAPTYAGVVTVENFITRKSGWVLDTIDRLSKFPKPPKKKNTKADFKKHKETAREFVLKKLALFNKVYNFTWNRIAIRNQKSRWGSCSSKRNLNFNYKIALLPSRLAEYIVVHELCHLGELNHSVSFWNLVSKTIPEYKEIRVELKKMSLRYY
jgi:predicted metal-dependent hydrolase